MAGSVKRLPVVRLSSASLGRIGAETERPALLDGPSAKVTVFCGVPAEAMGPTADIALDLGSRLLL